MFSALPGFIISAIIVCQWGSTELSPERWENMTPDEQWIVWAESMLSRAVIAVLLVGIPVFTFLYLDRPARLRQLEENAGSENY